MIIQGKLDLQLMKGPSLLFLDNEPLAKKLSPYDGEQVTVTFKLPDIEKKVTGIAEIFYFEGKDGYGGDKFTNDFDIEEFDCIEWLSNFDGKHVIITIE
ncbi:hypothetical protein [Rummeliibacillus pycnus]|uniref:hypothetical protein n=1 Tax=Rummeliibacillus pycnus TaxID=101070 RepID=UPI003D2C3C74